MRHRLLALLMCSLAVSCEAFILVYSLVGVVLHGGLKNLNSIKAAVVTPQRLQPGDIALLDYTLAELTLPAEGTALHPASTAAPPAATACLSATAGEVLPLPPAFYTPGGPLPEVSALRRYLAGQAQAAAEVAPLDLALHSPDADG